MEIESVISTLESEVSSGDVIVAKDSENLLEAEPSLLGGVSSLESGFSDIPVTVVCSVSPPDVVPLWESDISDYGVTDGLLLLILVALVFQTLLLRKR